jgi:hypothetical protein
MATEERELRRPYAAPSNVISVLQRARTRNLPDTIDRDFLILSQVPEVVVGRVMEALRFLGLVGDENRPTDDLHALAAASDEEYQTILANAIRRAYQADFDRVDPSKDAQPAILGAFRRYQPRSQTNRMVMLFLGLTREAGIPVLDAPRERSMRTRGPRQTRASEHQPERQQRSAVGREARHLGSDNRKEAVDGPGFHFGLNDEALDLLDDKEFEEVWSALGKVQRALARARRQPSAGTVARNAEEVGGEEGMSPGA